MAKSIGQIRVTTAKLDLPCHRKEKSNNYIVEVLVRISIFKGAIYIHSYPVWGTNSRLRNEIIGLKMGTFFSSPKLLHFAEIQKQ